MIALLLAVALADPAAAARRPNLVVIDICSARADRLAAYGGRSGTTPGLDEFSRDAAVFTRAWAQGS